MAGPTGGVLVPVGRNEAASKQASSPLSTHRPTHPKGEEVAADSKRLSEIYGRLTVIGSTSAEARAVCNNYILKGKCM